MPPEAGINHRAELAQEPDVVLEVETEVLDAVFQHRAALYSHSEREPAVFIAVYAACFEYVRVHHAASHDFEPSGMFADVAPLPAAEVAGDVHLRRGLREGEVGGSQTYFRLRAEELLYEVEKRLFHVGEGDPFVDIESLYLVENAVRTVGDGFVAEDPAGAYYPDRRFLRLHGAYLNGAGVGTEQDVGVFFDEERILHVACRMFRREVQGREYVPVVLYLRAFGYDITEPFEYTAYLVPYQRYGVPAAERLRGAGARHVVQRGRGSPGCMRFEFAFQFVDAFLCAVLESVEALAQFAFQFRGDGFEFVHQFVELTLAAQYLDSELFQLRSGTGVELLYPFSSRSILSVISFVLFRFS